MTRQLFSWLLPGLLLSALPACATNLPSEYSAEAIEARVIDADTKQPLQDVIVVAHWRLEGGGHGGHVGSLTILETVTDPAGRFYFPAWGPKTLPLRLGSLLGGLPLNTHLDTHDAPKLLMFKGGYEYRILSNRFEESWANIGESLRRSDWSGKRIEMKPFKGTMGEYARHLSSLEISLRFAYDNQNCEMKSVPRMVVALHFEERHFRQAGVYSSLTSLDSYLKGYNTQDRCGIRELLRSYMP